MVKQHVMLDIFHWEAIFISDIKTKRDLIEVKALLREFEVDKQYIDEVADRVNTGKVNGGLTFTDTSIRKNIVILYKTNSVERAINTLAHEIRHVVDDVCKHLHIEDVETPAHITGYISSVTFGKHIHDVK